jgi:hypothetical protein
MPKSIMAEHGAERRCVLISGSLYLSGTVLAENGMSATLARNAMACPVPMAKAWALFLYRLQSLPLA